MFWSEATEHLWTPTPVGITRSQGIYFYLFTLMTYKVPSPAKPHPWASDPNTEANSHHFCLVDLRTPQTSRPIPISVLEMSTSGSILDQPQNRPWDYKQKSHHLSSRVKEPLTKSKPCISHQDREPSRRLWGKAWARHKGRLTRTLWDFSEATRRLEAKRWYLYFLRENDFPYRTLRLDKLLLRGEGIHVWELAGLKILSHI